ncbi:MAG: hypothetical protein ACRDGR_04970 [bacterium]
MSTHPTSVLLVLAPALLAATAGVSHATLVPRTVLAEEFGYLA